MNVWNRFTNTVLEFFLIFRIRNTIHRMQDDLLEEQNRLLTTSNQALDRYVDDLLRRIDRDIKAYNNDHGRITLPDVHENLPVKIWRIQGEVKAWNGWFEDITSVRRKGACLLEKRITDKRFRLEVSLTLENLTLGYDDYQINVGSLKRRGKVLVKVGKNAILLRISLPPPTSSSSTTTTATSTAVTAGGKSRQQKKTACCEKAVLKEVVVTELEDINVNVTGCGKIGNKLAKKAILWMIKEKMDDIKEQIRLAVTSCVRSTIER